MIILFYFFSCLLAVHGSKRMMLSEMNAVASYKYNSSKIYNPKKNMIELVLHSGYDIEHHTVKTEDGYLLSLFRIPPKENSRKIFPHILQAGLFSNSAIDCLIPYKNSKVYSLHEMGYDVWLSNVRGKMYSVGHVSLDTCDLCEEYWKFTLDDIAKYDMPRIIDYVLEVSNKDQVFFHGHSMGVTQFLLSLAEQPEYNKKIKLGVLEAPVAFFQNLSPSIFDSVLSNLEGTRDKHVKNAKKLYGTCFDVFPWAKFIKVCQIDSKAVSTVCTGLLRTIWELSDKVSPSVFPTIFSHFPDQEGIDVLIHIGQNMKKEDSQFYKFDYGPEINKKIYGQAVPLKYNFKKVSAPVLMIFGDNDVVASEYDVETLSSMLENSRKIKVTKYGWSHSGNILSEHYGETIVDPTIEAIIEQEKQ